jgi:hypothetical protein
MVRLNSELSNVGLKTHSQPCKRVNQVEQQVLERTIRGLPHYNIPSLPLNTYYQAIITMLRFKAEWSAYERPSANWKA